jgi:hypothetical protein
VNCDTNLVPQPGATDFANCNTNLVPQPGATSPLHDACHEEFPDRFVSPDTNILDVVDQLAKDITERMNKLHFITKYLSHSCMVENHDGDLPVHLLARRLIEWEASWQGRLKLIEVETWSDATKFTQLHKLMGVCVDQVLNPMVRNRLACRSRGKPGTRILPLHAAAMFAVPFDTIQALLESYPEAAHTTCEFGHLHTYISNELLPLQLLERKRSDFVSSPSGRLQAKPSGEEIEPLADEIGGDGGIKWTKSTLCSTNIADDLIRRSDLIFSFNPNILPFRRDAVRIKRIELIIRAEAQVAMARRTKALDATARAAWTWICTFNEPLDEDDTYVDVVGRIVNALDVQTVEFLAALDTPKGTILTAAQPDCAHLIQLKLNGEQIEQCPNKPTSFTPQSSDHSDTRRPSILKPLKTKKDPAYILDGEICRNEFCREVFNVREQAIPTNFILLPYELLKNEDGSFGLVSPDSASIALQFAGCLTDLTQPWHVNHILEKKAIDCLDHKLTPKRATGFQTFNWRSKNMIQQLQRLFKGKGYLYLLDEETGGPIVSAPSDSNPISAIVVEHPVEAIHNLLPLLLLGMIRMRGDRSIVLIIETMISGKRSPPERWITIMQNITRHLYSRDNKLSNDDKEREELLALSEAVSDFVSRTTKRNTTRRPESDDGREWSSELSYLKRILDGSTAAKLSNVLSTNRQVRVAAKTKAIVVAEPLHNTNEHEDPLSHGTEQDDLLLQRSNEEFDKIWEPENDHSPQEAEGEHEHELSSEALTSFSDGDKLPESISKASSEDDSDKRRKIVIWNGDLNRKEEQVTAVVSHSNTLAKPPDKIWALEDDHSPQEAEGERELEGSSEALTSFSDGDKLPEPIYKASSEDDSEKRRDIIIWNGDLNRKEEQVTAVVNHSNTLVKPPDKIWELEDDHSPQEAKGEHELEVSSEALTSFSDGNKLPEPISKASSEDDSDKRRKIVILNGDLNRKEEQVTAVVNHSNTLAKPPDKIWALEDDHSPQEAEGENELEVSSEALTSFSDGDKLPEPIYKASSEDDIDKRRDIIILNGDLNRKEEQVTAVVNHSNTVAKPPRVPKFSSQLTEDKEKKLDEIKLRLQCMDALRCNEDPRCILVKEFANNDGVVDPLLNKDQEEHESHVDDTRDVFSNCLFSRLRSLEERIHDREDEIRELRRDVYSFERKAADAIYESLQDEDSALSKDDYSSSFTSAEGTTIVSGVSKHETVQSTLDDGTETSSSSSVPGVRSANHSSPDDGTETSASSSVPGERSANQSSLDDGTETSASSSVPRARSANPRFIIKEASDDESNQSSSSSSLQESAYSSITSMASSFPKRKATFTFEGAFTSTYVSSSSDEDTTQASLGNTDNNSDSTSGTGKGTYEYSNRGKKSENVSLSADDDSSYDSSSFGNPGSKHTPEKEGNRMDDEDACIPTTVFSSDDLDLLLKSFSVDDGPNVPGNPFSGDEQGAHPDVPGNPFSGDEQGAHPDVPGNPFSGDEQDAHPDVPGNPFSGDEQDAHPDVPGNPFSGDEQDMHPDVPGNPFSGDEQDSHPDVPGNPFSGDEQDSHPDVPGNPFSGDEQDAHPDVPGNPLAAMMRTARLRIRLPPKIQIRKVIHAADPTSTLIQT